MGEISFWYFWTIQIRKKLKNLILKKSKISGVAQNGSISADWIFRVANFALHFLFYISPSILDILVPVLLLFCFSVTNHFYQNSLFFIFYFTVIHFHLFYCRTFPIQNEYTQIYILKLMYTSNHNIPKNWYFRICQNSQ